MINKCRTHLNHWVISSSDVRKLDSASGFRRVIATHHKRCCCFACFLATSRDLISSPPTSATPFIQRFSVWASDIQTYRQSDRQTVEHLVFSVVCDSVLFSSIIFWSFCYPRFTYIHVYSPSRVSFSVYNTFACLAARMNGRSVGLSLCWFC